MFTTILVCSDGSDHAMRATRQAAVIAKGSDACVLLLNVNDPAKELMLYVTPWQQGAGDTLSVSDVGTGQDGILKRTAKLLDDSQVRYELLREFGHPAEQIVRVAVRESVDLIVLGSRGLAALESPSLGAVSDHILKHAPCSVLIVR